MRRRRSDEQAFTRFVEETEPRLSYALAAAYGPEVGAEATADALASAWENWERVRRMVNPAGYLYRVGQSRSRRYRRPRVIFPRPTLPETDPKARPQWPGSPDVSKSSVVDLAPVRPYEVRGVGERSGCTRRTGGESHLIRERDRTEAPSRAGGLLRVDLFSIVEQDGTMLIRFHETWRGGS
jgi:hypothetical protein